MKLNLACGTDYQAGWVNLDVVQWPNAQSPDVFWDARKDPIPAGDNTATQIKAGYLLLHLYPHFRPFVMSEIRRVLKPGGEVLFDEVDMKVVMERWLENPEDKRLNELIWGEVGDIHGQDLADYDRHTWGFTEGTLVKFIVQLGLKPLTRVAIHSEEIFWHLTITATKE
jgi:ubiquinone/menaquinone biosynthesis C-methylase UbiE